MIRLIVDIEGDYEKSSMAMATLYRGEVTPCQSAMADMVKAKIAEAGGLFTRAAQQTQVTEMDEQSASKLDSQTILNDSLKAAFRKG